MSNEDNELDREALNKFLDFLLNPRLHFFLLILLLFFLCLHLIEISKAYSDLVEVINQKCTFVIGG